MCSTLPLNLELLSSAIFHKLSFLVYNPTHGSESKESKELSWFLHLSFPKVSSAREVDGGTQQEFFLWGLQYGSWIQIESPC